MPSPRRIALVTVVAVALVSAGVDAVADERPGRSDPSACGAAELTVYESETEFDTVQYGDLSPAARDAFQRVRRADAKTASVDPALVAEFPGHVVYDGTTYRTSTILSECPLIRGVPDWLDPVLALFLSFDRAFSGLYLPAASLLVVGLAYRRVDAWLRFD